MARTTTLRVGGRYINAKNSQPLTLLYIGPLPPQNPSGEGSSSSSIQWLGVEYDDPTYGKGHSGTYEGIQVFQTRQEGAGAFIKLRTGNELVEGTTFVEAIKERYGYGLEAGEREEGMESVVLGSSSSAILVEAPGMDGVTKRLRSLEKLRQIGLENEFICGVGGTEAERLDLGKRLKGVTMLNISRNLMSTWTEVEEILQVVSGVSTLIMNDSRLDSASSNRTKSQITELYLARSLMTWSDVAGITCRFVKLEELHLSGNSSLSESPSNSTKSDTLEILSLDGCGIGSWDIIEKASEHFPKLATLNISFNPLHSLPRIANKDSSLLRLTNLVLLSSTLYSHISLANLSERVPKLETLRFSLAPDAQLATGTEGPKLSGNDEEDSGVLVALFPNLRLLNGNSVNLKQREDAERRWCSGFATHEAYPTLKRFYDTLSAKHGLYPTPQVIPQSTSLRSKLITLHVYPPSPAEAFTLPILPSASISLARRKIARKISVAGDGVRLYTVKRVQAELVAEDSEAWVREKVVEVGDGEVGYWFDDGDGLIVETV